MSTQSRLNIMHFSDILCVWAYIAQIRIDELLSEFGDQVELQYAFIPVFGAVEQKLETGWHDRGGADGYASHVQDTVKAFPHVTLHPELWKADRPTSSLSCHLFLKSVQLLTKLEELPATIHTPSGDRSPIEAAAWQCRVAFFQDMIDISQREQQLDIAAGLGFPTKHIEQVLNDGSATAALAQDHLLQTQLRVAGSPTIVLNEGRQILYGNVGYRVIQANVAELLSGARPGASWC